VNRQRDISLTTAIRDILLSFKNKKELKFLNNLTETSCHSSKHLNQKLICETYKESKKISIAMCNLWHNLQLVKGVSV
jgi:transposase